MVELLTLSRIAQGLIGLGSEHRARAESMAMKRSSLHRSSPLVGHSQWASPLGRAAAVRENAGDGSSERTGCSQKRRHSNVQRCGERPAGAMIRRLRAAARGAGDESVRPRLGSLERVDSREVMSRLKLSFASASEGTAISPVTD